MKALLKLTESTDDVERMVRNFAARGVQVLHRKYDGICLNDSVDAAGGLITSYTINHGGYGSSVWVSPGANFHSKWKLSGAGVDNEPNHKQLTDTTVCFLGESWQRDLDDQKRWVGKRGGDVVDAPGPDVDVVVCGFDVTEAQKTAAAVCKTALLVSEATFGRVLPKGGPRRKSKPVKRLEQDARALFKMLVERDAAQIDHGLLLAETLGDAATYDDLLADVSVDDHGALIPGGRFKGTGPHQPYLNHAILGLLSSAPEGSRAETLRGQLKTLTLEDAVGTPHLRGFDALEELVVRVAEGVTLPDLTPFGALPVLRRLTITTPPDYRGWGTRQVSVRSLEGLEAPALTFLLITYADIPHIDALSVATGLTRVTVCFCKSLMHIDGLDDATGLEYLDLEGCESLAQLEGVRQASGLTHANLKNCRALHSIDPLRGKPALAKLQLANCCIETTAPLADSAGVKVIGTCYVNNERKPWADDLSFSMWTTGELSGLSCLDASVEKLKLRLVPPPSGDAAGRTDLTTMPPSTSITTLDLQHPTLERLDGIEGLTNLRHLSLSGLTATSLELPDLPTVETLSCHGSTTLTHLVQRGTYHPERVLQLSQLSALQGPPTVVGAERLYLYRCKGMTTLSGLAGSPAICSGRSGYGARKEPSKLFTRDSPCLEVVSKPTNYFGPILDLTEAPAIRDIASLGPTPRPTIEALDLTGLSALTSLTGVEVFSGLKLLNVRRCTGLKDVNALKGFKEPIAIRATSDMPPTFFEGLKGLPKLYLTVDVTGPPEQLKVLEGLRGLVGLDLSVGAANLEPKHLGFVLGMDGLQILRVASNHLPPRSGPISEGTNKTTSITNFRKKLAKALGKALPKPAAPAGKARKAAPKGLRSMVSKLRKLLTAADFATIQQGVELLKGCGVPEVWDTLLEGIDPQNALIPGDSKADLEAMGNVFSRGKLKDALYARWATLAVLATAPEEATAAVEARGLVTRVILSTTDGQGWGRIKTAIPPPPSLAALQNLQRLEVYGDIPCADLAWLTGASLKTLILTSLSKLTDASALATVPDLEVLHLAAPLLPSLRGCEALKGLSQVALHSQLLADLSPLASSTELSWLSLKGCHALTSLGGLEGAGALSALAISDCHALVDAAALANKPALTTQSWSTPTSVYGLRSVWNDHFTSDGDDHHLDLSGAGVLSDLGFLKDQGEIQSLTAHITAGTDLSPVGTLEALDTARLTICGPGVHLRGLERVSTLSLTLDEAPSAVDPMPELEDLALFGGAASLDGPWPTLPALRTVEVDMGGLTSLGWLDAPGLEKTKLITGKLADCQGFSHTKSLVLPGFNSWRPGATALESFAGLEGNVDIHWLNLSMHEGIEDIDRLGTLPNLAAIKARGMVGLHRLTQTSVTWLELDGYASADDTTPEGRSLSFLKGWDSLRWLLLTDSGLMTDLDALTALPNLEVIHLRGSETKRDAWPDVLQDKVEYVAGGGSYPSPVKG